MLDLPFPPRRSHLAAFWVFLGLMLVGVSWFLLSIFGPGAHSWMVLAAIAPYLLAGVIWKRLPLAVFLFWNRAARRVARLGRIWCTALIHMQLLTARNHPVPALDIGAPDGSMWKRYASVVNDPAIRGTPIGTMLAQAPSARRGLLLLLAPMLIVLSWFRSEQNRAARIPENVYTLF